MNDSPAGFQFGPFTVDLTERLLLREGRVVPLTPKAFDLLALMVRNAGRPLTKQELMEQVWPDAFVEESNLAYNVFAVRKALGGTDAADKFIETLPRRGYRFVAAVIPCIPNRDPVMPFHSADAGGQGMTQGDAPASPPEATVRAGASPEERVVVPARRPWVAWSVATVTSLALMTLAFVHFGADPPPASFPLRFQIPVPVQLPESSPFAISPDGRHLAFVGSGSDGIERLWVRSLDALDARAVSGTAQQVGIAPPFWSPDSQFIAYDAGGGRLEKVNVSGGAPQLVCRVPVIAVGGAWNADNVIIVGNSVGGLMRCPASGGDAAAVTLPDAPGEDLIDLFPSFLPDGRHFLYVRTSRKSPETSGIFVGDLAADSAHQSRTRLIASGFGAAYIATGVAGVGYVVFARDATLFAQPFDATRLTLQGEAARVASPIGSYLDFAFFSASQTGALVFRAPAPDVQLTWFARNGSVLSRVSEPGRYSALALSPDGARAAVVKHAPQSTVDQDIWLFDLSRDTAPRRLTSDARLEFSPVWTRQGSVVVYGTMGSQYSVYGKAVGRDDPPRLLFANTSRGFEVTSMSPDGHSVLYTSWANDGDNDLWIAGLGGNVAGQPFLTRKFNQGQGRFSPDGQWVAYTSNESGPDDIFVAASVVDPTTGLAHAGESYQVSKGGGRAPRWNPRGHELLYLAADGTVMAVDIATGRSFQASPARALFRTSDLLADWEISPDGQRMLFAVPVRPRPPFEVMQNWNMPG